MGSRLSANEVINKNELNRAILLRDVDRLWPLMDKLSGKLNQATATFILCTLLKEQFERVAAMEQSYTSNPFFKRTYKHIAGNPEFAKLIDWTAVIERLNLSLFGISEESPFVSCPLVDLKRAFGDQFNINQTDRNGVACLMAGLHNWHVIDSNIRAILEMGADVNQQHPLYGKPVHFVNLYGTYIDGSLEKLKALTEYGADLFEVVDYHPYSLVHTNEYIYLGSPVFHSIKDYLKYIIAHYDQQEIKALGRVTMTSTEDHRALLEMMVSIEKSKEAVKHANANLYERKIRTL